MIFTIMAIMAILALISFRPMESLHERGRFTKRHKGPVNHTVVTPTFIHFSACFKFQGAQIAQSVARLSQRLAIYRCRAGSSRTGDKQNCRYV